MKKIGILVIGCCVSIAAAAAQSGDAARQALVARAKSFALKTPYVPPPGDPPRHYATGFAKIMCSAVFVTGLDPAFAAENVGYFVAPYDVRARLGKPKVDRGAHSVEVAVPNGPVRVARQFASQGCITLPIGAKDVFFK